MRRRLSGLLVSVSFAALLTAVATLTSCSGVYSGGTPGMKVTPAITWPAPAPITSTTPLNSTQLDATASVAGTFAYSPSAGTMLATGTQMLSVTFTPTNTAAYNTASASVSITVSATPAPTYIYVSTLPSANNTIETYGYSAGSDGTLTAISGSPVATAGGVEATNGKFVFGTDGVSIYTFSVASDGTIQQVASLNAQQYNSKTMSGGPCGGPTNLFLDRTGSNLYDLDWYSDCANNAYQSFNIDSTTGDLSYLGVTSTTTPIFETPLSFLSNDQFAYGASCYHWLQTIYGAARNSDGSLTALALNPGIDPVMPMAASGQIYCPYLTATDVANNVAVAVQPVDNGSLQPVGPYQLATYAADSSGNLTTTSTDSNMPAAAVTNSSSNSLNAIAISPSGSLLAVAGTGGLQVFHFNGANSITTYTSPLTADEIDQISWDKSNHLYAISQSKGRLYVFSVTTTTYSQASGSPYAIASPGNLVVLSQ